jgi:hypothetical protein
MNASNSLYGRMALRFERHNAAKLSLHWCARRTLPFTPVVNCKAHWLTEMIHFFAHSLSLLLDIRVPLLRELAHCAPQPSRSGHSL